MSEPVTRAEKGKAGTGGVNQGWTARLRREYVDLKNAMLTDEQAAFLSRMPRWFRGPSTLFFLLRRLFLKLTPIRRGVLIAGVLMSSIQVSFEHAKLDLNGFGILLILFVLMLELKDKLLATTELEDGHAIQRALLPRQSPRVPGWELWLFTRSANEVGGDLIDFFPVGKGRYALAVGDVAGKGLKAALLTAKLQATLRALSPEASSLSGLMGNVNRIFCRDGLPQMFSSLIYAEIAARGSSVRIMNAGHLPPLVVRGSEVTQLEKGGPALGLVPGAKFAGETVRLKRRELVLLYSDGVTEARNESSEFFGEDRLRTLLAGSGELSAASLGDLLLNSVDGFRGEARAHDDLTFLVLKRA